MAEDEGKPTAPVAKPPRWHKFINPDTGNEQTTEELEEHFRRSFEYMPPIEERDGSKAREAAPDRDKWQWRHSAEGHIHWVPPEIAYLIHEGEQWRHIERVLRPALMERELQRQIAEAAAHSAASDVTEARCLLITAFVVKFGMKAKSQAQLRRDIADWATDNGVPGAEYLADAEGTAFKQHVTRLLRLIRLTKDTTRPIPRDRKGQRLADQADHA